MNAPRAATCRVCGFVGHPLPIVYGYEDARLAELERRGLIVLGGCQVGRDSPRWACQHCRHELMSAS